MEAAMASFTSSLARHPLCMPISRRTGVFTRPQGAQLRIGFGCEWVDTDVHCTRKVIMASTINPKSTTKKQRRKSSTQVSQTGEEVMGLLVCDSPAKDNVVDSSVVDGDAPAVRPKGKRGRPKKVTKIEEPTISQIEEDGLEDKEEDFDFFKELEKNMLQDNDKSATNESDDVTSFGSANDTVGGGAATENSKLNGMEVLETTKLDPNIAEVARNDSTSGSQQLRQGEVSSAEKDQGIRGQNWIIQPDHGKEIIDITEQSTASKARADLGEMEDSNEVEEEEEQPLWVEEDDPTWPEEGDDGWGFRTSQFFDKVSIKNEKNAEDDDSDDEEDKLALNWENEADDWMIKEITSNEWEPTVFAEPSPLVVYVFARYGQSGKDGWKMLKELEKAVLSIWESCKAPLRAVKVDVGMEVDLGSALEIHQDECPQLIFIKNGKALHKLEGLRTSDELVQIMAYFFYNGARPLCLEKTQSPRTLTSIA